MTYEEFLKIATEFPGVQEAVGLGLVFVRREGQTMFSLKRDRQTVAIKLDWDTRDRLLADSPEKYYLTRNYRKHPWMLAKLWLLDKSEARELLKASWEDAPNPAKKRP